jgi:hypothetical protein
MSRILVAALALALIVAPVPVRAGSCDMSQSAYWSNLIHEENSIVASLLYIPYLIFAPPIRVINGIINPVPTSQSTIPPPAHRVPQ